MEVHNANEFNQIWSGHFSWHSKKRELSTSKYKHKGSVLVYMSCYNKIPYTGWLRNLFIHSLGSPRSKCWQSQYLLYRPISWFTVGTFSLCPHRVERANKLSRTLIRGLIPCPELFPHDLITYQKVPYPNAITLEIRFQHINFQGTKTFRL
jgi:hypothetical protein